MNEENELEGKGTSAANDVKKGEATQIEVERRASKMGIEKKAEGKAMEKPERRRKIGKYIFNAADYGQYSRFYVKDVLGKSLIVFKYDQKTWEVRFGAFRGLHHNLESAGRAADVIIEKAKEEVSE